MTLRERIEARLVDDARHFWRWSSVRMMLLNSAFLTTWALLPPDLKAYIPTWLMAIIANVVLALGVLGRVLKQKDHDDA